jgi:hypothetical protein
MSRTITHTLTVTITNAVDDAADDPEVAHVDEAIMLPSDKRQMERDMIRILESHYGRRSVDCEYMDYEVKESVNVQRYKDVYTGRIWIIVPETATSRGEDGLRVRMRDERDATITAWFSLPLSQHVELKAIT